MGPLTVDFTFLVDDNLLEDARRFAKELGLRLAEIWPILIHVHREYETSAHHFSWSDQRVNLYPASFASFRTEELYSAPICLSYTCLPVSVLIPRVAPLVACLVRLISQVRFDDPMCLLLKADLSTLIA